MERLMLTLDNGVSTVGEFYEVKKGILYLKVPPICSMILRTIKNK